MMRIIAALVLFLLSQATVSWEKIPAPTNASLRGLSLVDDVVAWTSGSNGTVLRTVNSGKTWVALSVAGAADQDFRSIHAFDRNTAIIASAGKAQEGKARIYRTTDGGQKWQLAYQSKTPGIFFDAVAFWDPRHGIVLSDPVDGKFVLFTTDDGGASWTQVPSAGIPPALANEGAFAASNSCLAVAGTKNAWFVTGGANVARVFRSIDGGRTWTAAETPIHPSNSSSGLFSIAFRDAQNGIAVGGDYAHPESSNLPSVLVTKDGGKTWQTGTQTDPPGIYLSSVAYEKPVDSSAVFAAGIKGLLYQPANGRWIKQSDENLNAIAFTRAGWGIAVGAQGTSLREKKSPHTQLK